MDIIRLDNLPPDILQTINSILDFPSQTNFTSVSVNFKKYPITNLLDNVPDKISFKLTDDILKSYPHVVKLQIVSKLLHWDQQVPRIYNTSNLNNVRVLHIKGNCGFDISKLTNLTSLTLSYCNNITNDDIKSLTNLTELNIPANQQISDINCLINLRKIDISSYTFTECEVDDNGIMCLTNLTELNADDNIYVENIGHLTNLTKLSANGRGGPANDALRLLTNLTDLNLSGNQDITNYGIITLTNLRILDISYTSAINDLGIAHLTNSLIIK